MNLPASSGHPPAVALWWDGGERAITAREKARIEEHSSSSFSIPLVVVREGWALVDLDDNAVVPQYPSSKMLDAGWPRGEFIADTFDVVGAYADLIALASPVGVFHGVRDAQFHADDLAVDAFAAAMKTKLAAARAKGRGGWEDKDQCGQQRLSDLLREHVVKGDLVDVSNFCMMLSLRGEGILPTQDINLGPRPMESAPRDGSMLRLLVQFTDHATQDTDGAAWTIGANKHDHDGEDLWQFAGWCWTHDHFTEGKGTPVGWLPLLDDAHDAASEVTHG